MLWPGCAGHHGQKTYKGARLEGRPGEWRWTGPPPDPGDDGRSPPDPAGSAGYRGPPTPAGPVEPGGGHGAGLPPPSREAGGRQRDLAVTMSAAARFDTSQEPFPL